MRIKDCEERIRHCMERCLIAAIDSKMTEEAGEGWFDKLYAEEEKVRQKDLENGKRKTTVLEPKHTSIGLCDLQAVLKILFYRKNYRNTTFRHILETDSGKITTTLDNLIKFRNKVLAHAEIAEMAKDPGEYSYDHALLDMLYMLRCFPEICGPAHPTEELQGDICYYDHALQVYQKYKDEGGMYDYAIAEIIKENGLEMTEEAFRDACDELGLPAFRTSDKIWYFSSRDPKVDIARVLELFRFKDMKEEAAAARQEAEEAKAAPRKQMQSLIIAGAVVLVLLALLASVFSDRFNDLQTPSGSLPDIVGNNQANLDEKIQEEMDTFVESVGNTARLKVGEGHKASGSVWLNGGGGSCYSTNEAVVTVSSTGNVMAVGEGEAFVVVKAKTGMYSVSKYIVSGKYQTEDERIQEEINTFVESAGNTTRLKVGEGHQPTSAVWLNGGGGSCYSTNEAVVTVSSSGNVMAVGEGEAFVVIKTGSGMHSVNKYIVSGTYQTEDERIQEAINSFVPTSLNTAVLSIGGKHTPTAAVWLVGGNGSCYSTDESVIVVSSTGTATAVGVGEAFVVIKTGGNMYSIFKYIVQ